MKHLRIFSTLLMSLLLASAAFAQTRDERTADTASIGDEISAARDQSITGISPDAKPDAKDKNTLAQFPRTRPWMQFPHQRGYSRGGYQTPWMDHDGAGHVLIGAAIGFGIGAALGAKNSAENGTTVSGGIMIVGGLFGLIGGCVGGAVGSSYGGPHPFAHRRHYGPSWAWPDDDEESNSGPHPPRTERSPSAKPVSPNPPAELDATARTAPVLQTPILPTTSPRQEP